MPFVRRSRIRFFRQLESMDCGAACLQMIAYYWGRYYQINYLKQLCDITRTGVNIGDISDAAKSINLDTIVVKTTCNYLKEQAPLPCILHWNSNHFVVLFEIKNKRYHIVDPALGHFKFTEDVFIQNWNKEQEKGIALLAIPNENFMLVTEPKIQKAIGLPSTINKYLYSFKWKLIYISLILLAGTGIVLAMPFILRNVIDLGVLKHDITIVSMFLGFQLLLTISQILFEWLKGLLLIHLGLKISTKIIIDFLTKLIRLPIHFFEKRSNSDLMQRILDQEKIEKFLSHNIPQTIFSMLTFLAMSAQLILFNIAIFIAFITLTFLSVTWLFLFRQRKAYVDYKRFNLMAEKSNTLYEIIYGITEIKINNAQDRKINYWRGIQQRIYQLELKFLNLTHYQYLGVQGFTQIKNVLITFLCAHMVINGSLTIGGMLSIGFIIGFLNGPIEQFNDFAAAAQEAKTSALRINEIHRERDENTGSNFKTPNLRSFIKFDCVNFKYPGSQNFNILKDLDILIPKGKTTAIVGASGSGKSTLLKLILGFYAPTKGNIYIDDLNLREIDVKGWRNQCGAVLQEGYIYSDTIAANISMSDDSPCIPRLEHAAKIAGILEFIFSLPQQFAARIGKTGMDLSTGQKQRILIARAVYKKPELIFFDEATSSLDATNEKVIWNNLMTYFSGKTVLVIAHRLSTVKKADQILVLENGRIEECGTHLNLVNYKGKYFNLIKDQLELSG